MDTKTFKASCKNYFDSTDLYEVFGITKISSEKDVKNAYRRLSLQTHPDRVSEEDKEVATEKFKIVSQIYSILSDPQKRKSYDKTGDIESDVDADWLSYWRSIFKEITDEEIENYEKKYIGGEEERGDIKDAYIRYAGDMNKIMDAVPFSNFENEDRISGIIRELIAEEEVPDYDIFTKETAARKKKRMQKMMRQRREFEKAQMEENQSGDDSFKALQLAISQRQNARQSGGGFLEALEKKYANEAAEKKRTKTETKRSSKRSK